MKSRCNYSFKAVADSLIVIKQMRYSELRLHQNKKTLSKRIT